MSALMLGFAALSPLLVACGGGGDSTPQTVSVWRSLDSLQCSGGGLKLPDLEARLQQAGVRVLSSSCGSDGRIRIAACDSPDGRIGIFRVEPGAQLPQDFRPLSELPDARPLACE